VSGICHFDDLELWAEEYADDARWQTLRFGLAQLSPSELGRVGDWLRLGMPMALDTYNYDPTRQLWCPLAIGLGVPEFVGNRARALSNEDAKVIIQEVGESLHPEFSLNPMSGTRGSFFTRNRRADMTLMCRYLEAVDASAAA
jgi:hypothetical protein